MLIALIGTMSGEDEWRGTDAFEGAHFGVSALNRSVNSGQPSFELITRDDRGDPERAAALVTQVAADPRYAGVVYAGPTSGLPPAETALEESGIPGVLCYGDLYSERLLRSNLFQVSTPFAWEGARVAAYLARDRRYLTTGVVVEKTLDGRTAASSLQAGLDRTGAAHAIVERYSPKNLEFRAALARLRRSRAEAIVVQGSPRAFDQVVATLRAMEATYRTTAAARFASAPEGADLKGRRWRPQVVGFDAAIHSSDSPPPEGTVAADGYARRPDYLPIPSFRAFRSGFVDWWGHQPLGWQLRAYEAVQMIGWARLRTDAGGDVAATLERLRGERFGGLDITLSDADHMAVDESTVGLWTIPRDGIHVPERSRLPVSLSWVPIARTFSGEKKGTLIPAADWPYLYRGRNDGRRPPPEFSDMRFGVTTPKSDPVH
jgi:ABC-type branched-subunit amino acid transport system substrate-binding protein